MNQQNEITLIMKRLLLALILFTPMLLAAEETRWYQVEVIVFAHNNSDYHNSEHWPIDYSLPLIEGSQALKPAAAKSQRPQPFSLLPAADLQLGGTASRINKASDVELLMHFGWIQPGLEENKATAIHIYDGMLEGRRYDHRDEVPRLDGTLRLILSRYLHLESDLIWRDPLGEEEQARMSALPVLDNGGTLAAQLDGAEEQGAMSAEENPGTATGDAAEESALITHHVYRMQQSRRMRSNEIHYLDHPRFGIVAFATRYEP